METLNLPDDDKYISSDEELEEVEVLLVEACSVVVDDKQINVCHGDTVEVTLETKITVESGPTGYLLFQVNDQPHERVKLIIGESFTMKHLIEIISPKIKDAVAAAGLKFEEKEVEK